MTPDWRLARLGDIAPRELYEILQLRAEVFVVEQACAFQDLDGADLEGWHLWHRREGRVAAYSRLLAPGVKFAEPSIGRVTAAMPFRSAGLGRALMVESIARARSLWPGLPIRLGAQQRLERFYGSLGFVTASTMYLEDGIPHIEMVLSPEVSR